MKQKPFIKSMKVVPIAIGGILIISFIFLTFFLGHSIKLGVERFGPMITKTSVTLEGAELSLFTGNGQITGLVIGNPEGFKTPYAMSMGKVRLEVDTRSLFSNSIVIRQVLIEGPEITFEASENGSNIKALQRNIEGDPEKKKDDDTAKAAAKAAAEKEAKEEKAKSKTDKSEKKSRKKILIRNLVIRDGKINISGKRMNGKTLTIPLPAIVREDLGKKFNEKMSKGVGVKEKKREKLRERMRKQRARGLRPDELASSLFDIISEGAVSAVSSSGALRVQNKPVEKLKTSVEEGKTKAIDKLKALMGN